MVWKNKAPKGYKKGSARKFKKSSTSNFKKDKKAFVYDRKYQLNTKIIGAKRDVLVPRTFAAFTQTKRKYLKMIIRKFPKYFLSTGSKTYDYDFPVRPLYAEAILLTELPSPFEFINQNDSEMFGIPKLDTANPLLKRIRLCEFIMESELISYKDLVTSQAERSVPIGQAFRKVGDEYLIQVASIANTIGYTPNSMFYASPSYEGADTGITKVMDLSILQDPTYKGVERRFRWANYMKCLYLYWIHFAHMIILEGVDTLKVSNIKDHPSASDLAGQLILFLKCAGFAPKDLIPGYTVSDKTKLMRSRMNDLQSVNNTDYKDDGNFADIKIFEMLSKVFNVRKALTSFNGAWTPLIYVRNNPDQFLEGQQINLTVSRLFGGMSTLAGQALTGQTITPSMPIGTPGIQNVIGVAKPTGIKYAKGSNVSTLLVKGFHSLMYRNTIAKRSMLDKSLESTDLFFHASVAGVSWTSRTYTPKQLVQQQSQYQQSRSWYQRNDYGVSSLRTSLIVRPAKIVNHHETLDIGHYAFDEQIAFLKNVGTQLAFDNEKSVSQAVVRISLSQTLTDMIEDQPGQFQRAYREQRSADLLGSQPPQNDYAVEPFGKSQLEKQLKRVLEYGVALNAQKYVPTTYFIDYDEESLQTLGLSQSKLDKLLSDRVVTLSPDVATLTVSQLSDIASLFTKFISQINDTIKFRGHKLRGGPVDASDVQMLGESFNDRLYACLQQYRDSGAQDSEMYSFVLYSVLKAARYNLKFLPEETKNISLQQQLLGLGKYFELLSSHNKKNGNVSVVLDLSIPTYKIKYLEHVKTITVSYPQPAGFTVEDLHYNTSLSSCPFVQPFKSVNLLQSSMQVYQEISNQIPSGAPGPPGRLFGLFSSSLLSLQRHLCRAVQVTGYALTLNDRTTWMAKNSRKSFVDMFTRIPKTFKDSVNFDDCVMMALTTLNDSPSVSIFPTLKVSTVYRRKTVVPGMHLMQMLKRGKVLSVSTARPLQPTSMFLYGSTGSNVSGMLNEGSALMSGVDNYPSRQTQSLKEFYDDYSGTLSANYSYPKVLALNLVAKQQVRMMQLMYQQSQYQVSSTTQMGLAAVAWRKFDDVVALAGVPWTGGFLWDNQINRVQNELNPGTFDLKPPIELVPAVRTFPIGFYSPVFVDFAGTPEVDHTYTAAVLKKIAFTDVVGQDNDVDVNTLSLHCQSFRLKRMVEQDLRKNFAIDYDTYLKMFAADGSFTPVKGLAIIDYLHSIKPVASFMPAAERFQFLRDYVNIRNTQWVGIVLQGHNAVAAPKSLLTTMYSFVGNRSIVSLGLSQAYQRIKSLRSAAVRQDAVYPMNPLSQRHLKLVLDSMFTTERPDIQLKLSKQYRVMAQSAMVQSNFSKWISAVKSQYKRHKRNPYWVDCYFGTYLSFGENTDDVIQGLHPETVDWIHIDLPTSKVVFPSFSTTHVNGVDVVNVPKVYELQGTAARPMRARIMTYASDSAELLDNHIFTSSFLGTFSKEINASRDGDPLMKRLISKYRQNLDDLGFTNHHKRHDIYLGFDPTYKSVHDTNDDAYLNITVSDPSCVKFTTDILLYELPLTFAKDSSSQQAIIQRNYQYKPPKDVVGITVLGMRDLKYFQHALTMSKAEILSMPLQMNSTQQGPETFFNLQRSNDPAQTAPRLAIPLTILERLFFQAACGVVKGTITEFKLVQFCMQAKLSFHLMYKHFHTVLEMYVTVGYTKIQDYDIYFVLQSMQSYLQSYASSMRILVPPIVDFEDPLNKLIYKQAFNDNGTAFRLWYVQLLTWVEKVYPSLVDVRNNFDVYYPLWAPIPRYRVKSDQLFSVRKEMVDYTKNTSKQQRGIVNSISRDPFRRSANDYGFKQYADRYDADAPLPDLIHKPVIHPSVQSSILDGWAQKIADHERLRQDFVMVEQHEDELAGLLQNAREEPDIPDDDMFGAPDV